MDPELPTPLAARLEGESALAAADLGGDDLLVVTPSRTLVYRAEGLLRDESVEAYPHEMDRLVCRESRRKATLRMEYLDGPREFSVGADRLDDVLEAVLAGVLAAAGVTEPGEAVASVFRFSELTLIVTERRAVKHVGAALWDEDYEQFPFEDVTDLAVEEGTVSTQLVLTVDGRPRRVKAPASEARRVHRALEEALLSYHDAGSLSALRARDADDEDADGDDGSGGTADADGETAPDESGGSADAVDGMEGIDAIDAVESPDEDARNGDAADTRATDSGDGSAAADRDAESAGFRTKTGDGEDERIEADESDGDADDGGDATGSEDESEHPPDPDPESVHERLDALEAAVERQSERIDEQRATIERLVEELRRGR